MKQVITKLFTITALLSSLAIQAHSGVSPTLAYRSQGFHSDRQRDVGQVNHTHLFDMEGWYGTFDAGLGYMRSFNAEDIARCLFGCDLICNSDCNNTIKVQGSGVANRDAKAWLADYFYLNCEYDGCFSFRPRIQNIVVDLDFYLGLDDWVDGAYFRVYGPITYTKWETRFCVSDPSNVSTDSCSTGYFTSSGDEVLLKSLTSYFSGCAPTPVSDVTFKGLKYAKMPACDETKVGLAELRAELGWNFFQDTDYHIGAGLHIAAPAGNKRKAEYVMHPVVGNGNHWELGATAHGHYRFWKSDDESQHVGFYFDALVTHLFKASEQRTFDLCGKNNSRYMLASQFTRTITNGTNGLAGIVNAGIAGTQIDAFAQFNNVYAPVANLTTADVKVYAAAQVDVSAMFNYTRGSFSWDVGYNFWGRTCEKIECPNECDSCNADSIFNTANANKWGLKGDARMFGYAAAAGTIVSQDATVPLSATQSNATIHAGTNFGTVDATLTDVSMQNGGVDNSLFAITDTGGDVRVIHTPIAQGGVNENSNQIKTSIQPVFITSSDVSFARTKGISNKIFTHLSYSWEKDNWIPFIGLGGSAEFGHNDCCNECSTSTSCCTGGCETDCCHYCSLSQWSIWIKGGLAFD